MYFSNIPVSSTSVYKHLGMLLDDNFCCEHHVKLLFIKISKTIDLLCKFNKAPETVFNYNLQIAHSATFRLWLYCF